MELTEWIADDLASLQRRLENGVLAQIPVSRRRERVDDGGIAPTYILWHAARHHDVAINRVIRGATEVVDEWTDRLGVHDDLWRGLAEAEDSELVDELDGDAVGAYALAVIEASSAWITALDDDRLDALLVEVPDSTGALDALGLPGDRFDWLYGMWTGQPGRFFLQWEAIGHGYNHLGELISIRNRMGLSPF